MARLYRQCVTRYRLPNGKAVRKGAADARKSKEQSPKWKLPEAQHAEVIGRLDNPQPDPSLAAILAAWPKLLHGVRAGVVQAVEGFASPPKKEVG